MTDRRINVFSCLVAGLGVGIAVGGLFAPRTGAATRRLIQREARKARRLVRTTMQEGAEYVARHARAVLDEASEIIDRSEETFNKRKDKLGNLVGAGKEAYRAAAERLAHTAS